MHHMLMHQTKHSTVACSLITSMSLVKTHAEGYGHRFVVRRLIKLVLMFQSEEEGFGANELKCQEVDLRREALCQSCILQGRERCALKRGSVVWMTS